MKGAMNALELILEVDILILRSGSELCSPSMLDAVIQSTQR